MGLAEATVDLQPLRIDAAFALAAIKRLHSLRVFLRPQQKGSNLRKESLKRRLALAAGPTLHLAPGRHGGLFYMDLLAIAFVVVGYGAYQPATYAGVKLYTDKRTAAMGFAMIYAVMNLGSFTAGLLSPPVRRLSAAVFPPSGITGVFWLYVGLTVMALVATLMFVPRRDPQPAASEAEPDTSGPLVVVAPPPRVFSAQWFREHPLSDGKFLFFIFILIPVQTLFAHNWLTLPLYIERAFRHAPYISDNFEFFSNINPLLIFILTPLLAVVTARANVYWMMIVGTAIMAAPSFLLALGPKPALLLVFILVMIWLVVAIHGRSKAGRPTTWLMVVLAIVSTGFFATPTGVKLVEWWIEYVGVNLGIALVKVWNVLSTPLS